MAYTQAQIDAANKGSAAGTSLLDWRAQQDQQRLALQAEQRAKTQQNSRTNQANAQQGVTAQQQQQTFAGAAPSAGAATTAGNTAHQFSSGTGAGYTVNPYGSVSYDNAAQQQRQTQQSAGQIANQTATHQAGLASDAANQAADLQRQQDARRLASIQGLTNSFNSGGGTVPPREGGGFDADESAARMAALGRAKDTIGAASRGAVDSLRDAYGGSGNSGAQRQGMENIMAGGLGEMSDFALEQMLQDFARSGQISDRNYQGNITQRGQDIQAQQSKQQILMGLYSQLY